MSRLNLRIAKKRNRKNAKATRNFHKSSEFKAALYASLIAFAISPITQIISYKLSEYWSRPILSIEYASMSKVLEIDNIATIQTYFSKSKTYDEFLSKNYVNQKVNLKTIKQDSKSIQHAEIYQDIINELEDFINYLDNIEIDIQEKKNKLIKMPVSELRIASLMFTNDDYTQSSSKTMKTNLDTELSKQLKSIQEIKIAVTKIKNETKLSVVGLQFKLSILNRGSTDGLIRNEGNILINDSSYILNRITPISSETLHAVPTFNVNPSAEFSSNSVGRIEKNTMTELWFQAPVKETDTILRKTIILKDQNNHEIIKLLEP